MAKALDKKLVAEGVESTAHVRLLDALGCHVVQGYVYYPPLEATACATELRRLQAGVPAGTD
ncbi:EAL domain-containing protein [Pseudoxanthomonas sp. NC8]|nr:EAL domain-containing protein [Pseudoxanthomonas sp. NC8]